MLLPRTSFLALAVLGSAVGPDRPPDDSLKADPLKREIAARHARLAHAIYDRCVTEARRVRDSLHRFTDQPDAETLEAARRTWLAAREIYGRSEVLRFSGGPIDNRTDGVETYINAWPVDESYIDGVEGAPDGGIINDPERYPNLNGALLTFANERGGEANISIGWHAIEFLLWGQDLDPDGPGRRTARDFVDGFPNAGRRREYLRTIGDLLVEHLTQVRDQWQPDATDNYRARFESKDTRESMRDILRGLVVLSGFEMSGERMAVVFETRDQEDEHSCFSDNTHRDLITNQRGVMMVFRGEDLDGQVGPSIRDLAKRERPELAAEIDRLLDDALTALEAIPVPFDRSVRAAEGSDERQAVGRAIVALEAQAEAFAALGLELGYQIPMQPGER